MTTHPSRYRPDSPSDYSHRLHAGNVGDVWKHCVLVEILRCLSRAATSVTYVDTHAGEATYRLGATGEWTEGIGRLWNDAGSAARDDAVGRYLALCRRLGSGGERPEQYPGSPAFARAVLGRDAELSLWERDPTAAVSLRDNLREDSHVHIEEGDGLAALAEAVVAAEAAGREVVVLVDPPWTQKVDWTAVPDALAKAVKASSRATFVLWYPVKSLTRPNAMFARFAAAGVAATMAELITTPLEHQRRRLNGSGVVLVRPPAGAAAALAAAAPVLGPLCATRGSAWSLRMQAWSGH